jgi:hypothetical protein
MVFLSSLLVSLVVERERTDNEQRADLPTPGKATSQQHVGPCDISTGSSSGVSEFRQ